MKPIEKIEETEAVALLESYLYEPAIWYHYERCDKIFGRGGAK